MDGSLIHGFEHAISDRSHIRSSVNFAWIRFLPLLGVEVIGPPIWEISLPNHRLVLLISPYV